MTSRKEQCRLHRERRILLRRIVREGKGSNSQRTKANPSTNNVPMLVMPPPVVGRIAIKGGRSAMEDEVSIRPNLCAPAINLYRPIHFYAVYDGHGGRQVSALCNERLHAILAEELMHPRPTNNTYMTDRQHISNGAQEWEAIWRTTLQRCFIRVDKLASFNCHCGSLDYNCGCPQNHTLGLTGSTAVMAVLTDEYIIVANCGDSRAVLSSAEWTIPLSYDHKPDRPDELARIQSVGGTIVYSDHGLRVQGALAMSRAIGDNYLKPYIIPEPEITFIKRHPEDQFLILASDGLWDVVPSDMACQVVRECFQEEEIFFSQSTSAAALLARLATARGSHDNTSVIVVDLRNHVAR